MGAEQSTKTAAPSRPLMARESSPLRMVRSTLSMRPESTTSPPTASCTGSHGRTVAGTASAGMPSVTRHASAGVMRSLSTS